MDTCVDPSYKELVEHQQDMLVKFSPEGRLLFVNTAYCETMSKSKDELIGSIFMPSTDQRYSDAMSTQMAKLFRPPYVCQVEQWISSSLGLRCISWSARSITNEKGEVTAIVASGRDVTRLQKEHRNLRKQDDELRLLLESGSRMYYTHSLDHTLHYVSPRLRSLFRITPRSGKRLWTDYLTDNPINAKGLERTLKAISSGRREPPYTLEFFGRDETPILVKVDEIPIVKNKQIIAIAGFIEDITERKKVEEGINEAEILIKEYSMGRKSDQESLDKDSRGPFAAIKSLLSHKNEEDNTKLS